VKTWTSVKSVGGLHSLSMEFSFVEFNLCTSREGWALAEWAPQAHSFHLAHKASRVSNILVYGSAVVKNTSIGGGLLSLK